VPVRLLGLDIRGMLDNIMDMFSDKQKKQPVPAERHMKIYMDTELLYEFEAHA